EAEADLRQLKTEVGGGHEAAASSAELAPLQNELQALRDQLAQKDGLIVELKDEAKSHPIGDPESYEAELNRFRKELEADRARHNRPDCHFKHSAPAALAPTHFPEIRRSCAARRRTAYSSMPRNGTTRSSLCRPEWETRRRDDRRF